MEAINSVLSGFLLPLLLIICGIWFGSKLKFFYIFHPIKLTGCLFETSDKGGISPFRSLTVALAGTLGVGNMAGVATAIVAGGAGALFWMWISAVCAMSVKYMEVKLAIQTREKTSEGWRGGAMYYIKTIFGGKIGNLMSVLFAVMCAVNSLVTGNIVQINSACAAIDVNPVYTGLIIGIIGMWIAAGGGKRISGTTVMIIPLLSAIYIVICLAIIFNNIERIPAIFANIINEAFSLRSVSGGIGGFTMARAMRFGVTRGIFSNEAGCGTSPTAHAQADCKSPHHQGCFGIFEVFADTILLCTMTGLVILLSKETALDGIPLTLYAFKTLAGAWAEKIIAISIVLFAFATVIGQASYGLTALDFLRGGFSVRVCYLMLIPICSLIGALINAGFMWQIADLIVSFMTIVNVFSLSVYIKRQITSLTF